MLKFFILNRLKVTKFLVKISEFKFLVKTDQTFFVYKLFLLLNISDFSLPSRYESNPKETVRNSPPKFMPLVKHLLFNSAVALLDIFCNIDRMISSNS